MNRFRLDSKEYNPFKEDKNMRNIFALVGLATVTFVGLGWYLGWYQIDKVASDKSGHSKYELDVNEDKLKTDGEKFVDEAKNLINSVESKNGSTTPPNALPPLNKDTSKDASNPNTTNGTTQTSGTTTTDSSVFPALDSNWHPIGNSNSTTPKSNPTLPPLNLGTVPPPK